MTARKIISEALWTSKYTGVDTLIEYRKKLRNMEDILTSPEIIKNWTEATDHIDKLLYVQGVPQ